MATMSPKGLNGVGSLWRSASWQLFCDAQEPTRSHIVARGMAWKPHCFLFREIRLLSLRTRWPTTYWNLPVLHYVPPMRACLYHKQVGSRHVQCTGELSTLSSSTHGGNNRDVVHFPTFNGKTFFHSLLHEWRGSKRIFCNFSC